MRALTFLTMYMVFSTVNADSTLNHITFSGPVKVVLQNTDGSEKKEITDINKIRAFDGSVYLENSKGDRSPVETSEYLVDSLETKPLYDLGVRGGTIKYKFKEKTGQLWLVTEYTAPKKLTQVQLDELQNFTEESWIDGEAVGFTYELSEANNGITPMSFPSEIHVSQSL